MARNNPGVSMVVKRELHLLGKSVKDLELCRSQVDPRLVATDLLVLSALEVPLVRANCVL